VIFRRTAISAAALVLASTLPSSGRAGFTPAWSYLSPQLRMQLAAKEGGTLYLPARTALFYRYRSGAKVAGGALSVPFTNRVRVRHGVWRWTAQTFLWQVRPLSSSTSCTSWKPVDQTLQLSGNKVYWSDAAGTAWRCVAAAGGRTVVLSASASRALGAVGLGEVVASGLDVSRRTTPVVALGVTPTVVHRGALVVVRGVAGGCTSGDTVTILSDAFPAAHSFAGVPAVYGQVGAAGRFSARLRIPSTVRTGSYVITARCGGGNLGVSATLKVIR
jgi:hypothetical protein